MITEKHISKSGQILSSRYFELFENYEIKVAKVDSTTTYTIPVKQQKANSRQFSNLILTYVNHELKNSFILKYEGTSSYFDRYIQDKEAAFEGTVSAISLSSSFDLFQKSAICQTVTINFCRNDDFGGIGSTHVAGANCKNRELMYSISKRICREPTYLATDGPGSGGGGGGDYADGGGFRTDPDGSPITPGDNTSPIPDPCPASDVEIVDGLGGCYDPGDDVPDFDDPILEQLNFIKDKLSGQLRELKTLARNVKYEKAYVYDFNENSNNLNPRVYVGSEGIPNPGDIDLKTDGSTVIIMHNHYQGLISMFSFRDLFFFYNMAIVRNVTGNNENDCYSLLVTKYGTYAMAVNDYTALVNQFDNVNSASTIEQE